MAIIEIENIKKSFDTIEVLKQITFDVNTNDVIAVIGSYQSDRYAARIKPSVLCRGTR